MRNLLLGLFLLSACPKPQAPPENPPQTRPAPTIDAQETSKKIDAALTRAAQAYKDKDFATMVSALEEVTKLSPYNPDLKYRLARGYALHGQSNEALALLEKLAAMELVYRLDHPDLASLQAEPKLSQIEETMKKTQTPIHPSQELLAFSAPDLLTEGIAYDETKKRFLVGSVHQRTILQVDENGQASPFLKEPVPGLYGVFGMRVDAQKKSLWVASAALPEVKDLLPEEKGRAGVFRFSLKDARLEKAYPAPNDGKEHVFGDVALGAKGEVFVSDSASGEVFWVDPNKDALEVLLPAGFLRSPQGLALSPDESTLFVLDYAGGIYRLERATQKLTALSAPEHLSLYGMDGLLWYQGSLIVIQNGARPARVLRLFLSGDQKSITRIQTLERGAKEMVEPTLGVIVQEKLYFIASSQWPNFDGPALRPAADCLAARLWSLSLNQ